MNGRILDRLERLQGYVGLLEGLRGKDFSEPYVRGALERYLHLCAECVLDIGEMVISKKQLAPAPTYRDVIRRLGEAGILDADFAAGFAAIASLRNILVHDYAAVDVTKLEGFLDRLEDFRTFARQVTAHLD